MLLHICKFIHVNNEIELSQIHGYTNSRQICERARERTDGWMDGMDRRLEKRIVCVCVYAPAIKIKRQQMT